MKNNFILMIITSLIFFSCEKKDFWSWHLVGKAQVEDLIIKSNALQKFSIEANFKNTGNDKDAQLGFIFSKNVSSPDLINCDTIIYVSDSKPGIKIQQVDWYTNGSLRCRAFIKNKIQIVYSETLTINWPGGNANLPMVNTISPYNVSFYTANCGANLSSNGGLAITKLGLLISTQSVPTFNNSYIIEYVTSGTIFEKEIENLDDNTTYYCRAFAENLAGIALASTIQQFMTKKFYQVGEPGPAGGIIFYSKLDSSGGWNFLECAPNDLTSSFPWAAYNNSVTIDLGTSLGYGKTNTTNIVNTFGLSGLNYAAKMCFILNQNGFDDWFLPSRDELITLYQNLYLQNLGSFTLGARYWTSSGDDYFTQNAWCQKMSNNSGTVNSLSELKTMSLKIRPIRCF